MHVIGVDVGTNLAHATGIDCTGEGQTPDMRAFISGKWRGEELNLRPSGSEPLRTRPGLAGQIPLRTLALALSWDDTDGSTDLRFHPDRPWAVCRDFVGSRRPPPSWGGRWVIYAVDGSDRRGWTRSFVPAHIRSDVHPVPSEQSSIAADIFALSPCQREVLHVPEPWRVFELFVAGFDEVSLTRHVH